jgi:hypothetical protein
MNNSIELTVSKEINSNKIRVDFVKMIFEKDEFIIKYNVKISHYLDYFICNLKKFLISIQNNMNKSEFEFDVSGTSIYKIIFENNVYNFMILGSCYTILSNFKIKKDLTIYFDNLIYHLEHLDILEKLEKKNEYYYKYTII